MSRHPHGEDLTSVPGWVPPLTDEDIKLADKIAKEHLGEEVTADSVGSYVRGTQGDAAFYGEGVVIVDPDIGEHVDDWAEYAERISKAATAIGNTVHHAGNVVIDVTHLAKPK